MGQGVNPLSKAADRHGDEFGDGLACHADIGGLLAQTGAVTLGANGLATIAAEHHAVLYLVLVFLYHAEEVVDAGNFVFVSSPVAGQAVP